MKRKVRAVILALLLLSAVGLGIRLVHIDEPPLDFNIFRNFRALIITRSLYFQHLDSIEEWRKDLAKVNEEQQGVLEPRVMEYLALGGYFLLGREAIWFPRVLSCIWWILGGLFLFLISRRITSHRWTPILSLFIYLFTPFGAPASRAFMPDPLMIMLTLFGVLLILKAYEAPVPAMGRLAAAALIFSLALFVKPTCFFILLCIYFFLRFHNFGFSRKLFLHRDNVIFLGVAASLPLLYILYGHSIGGFLSGQTLMQAKMSFMPPLLLTGFFWKGWFTNICTVIGPILFFLALAGIPFFGKGRPRAAILGAWIGYFLYGVAFHYHCSTHDYYSLFLIPIAALSIGSITDRLFRLASRFRLLQNPILRIVLVVLHVALIGYFYCDAILEKTSPDPASAQNVEQAQRIGDMVGHSKCCVFLATKHVPALRYYGEIGGLYWPNSGDIRLAKTVGRDTTTTEEMFEETLRKIKPTHFVILNLDEYRKQDELARLLEGRFEMAIDSQYVRIFDLRREIVR